VAYTPDAVDANGGYFVYSINGDPWWIISADFKFQSVIGAGVWKEFQDAEADGLPLTATDMDNIYRYDGGIVYDPNGKAVGRYCAERDDLSKTYKIRAMVNGGRLGEVVLASYGNAKIPVIKAVKEITGLGLLQARDLVESAPTIIWKGQTNEANAVIASIQAAGGVAYLR
jgi:hypothetical protein